MKTILFFGECMLEEQESQDSTNQSGIKFGGDTFNTAVYLSRLTNSEEIKIQYATSVGKDKSSRVFLDYCSRENISTDYVTISPTRELGKYWIRNSKDGERTFRYDRKNSAARYYFENPATPLEIGLRENQFDYFYFSGISLLILNSYHREYFLVELKNYKKRGGKIIFDNNFRHGLTKDEPFEFYSKVMQLADLVFLSEEDEDIIYKELGIKSILNRVDLWGVRETVIKQGAKGCAIYYRKKLTIIPSLRNVVPVDTTAAGDSFAAGYLSIKLTNNDQKLAAEKGHLIASKVISYPSAIIPKELM